jgi:predicted nucleotidyltransferase
MELEEKLKKAFKELENHGEIKIEFAYLFGSCAEDTHTFRSDIDLKLPIEKGGFFRSSCHSEGLNAPKNL